MPFPFFRTPLAVAMAILTAACSLQMDPGSNGEPTGTTGGMPPPPPPNDAKLAFEEKGTLALAPGETRTVTVIATPPNSYEISFALLGAPLDASLDKSKVAADGDGRASVTLKAPNASTTFKLRASIKDGPFAELPIAVSDKGFGSLRVVPVYAGTREVTTWIASAVTGTNCKAIANLLNEEFSAPQNATAPAGEEPLIESVPVGPNVAVVLRAGYYIWGCTDEPNLKAGQELAVKVPVIDKPIDLSATDLDLELTFTTEGAPYADIMKEATFALAGGILPSSIDGASSALLDAMIAKSPPDITDALIQERSAQDWDTKTGEHLGMLPIPPKEQLLQWIEGKLNPGGDPLVAMSGISGRLVAAENAPNKSLFLVKTFGGVDAQSAGIPASHLMTWTADASDTVMLGGTLYWMPSRYVGGVALEAAKEAMPGLMSMSEALAAIVGCPALAASLGGAPSCDAGCLEGLCQAALGDLWQNGLDASALAGVVGEIGITASGPAKVDNYAAPMSFEGTWLGTLSNGSITASLEGTVVGAPAQSANLEPNP
ncbi:MAG: hypothetical protein HUU21_25280 [Polyangiaceae bacterium]|nr:hypothetical protein [Polyangiaceae bacterium]